MCYVADKTIMSISLSVKSTSIIIDNALVSAGVSLLHLGINKEDRKTFRRTMPSQ